LPNLFEISGKSAVFRAAGTIRARAVLANPDRVFTPGLYARVSLQALLIDGPRVVQSSLAVGDKAVLRLRSVH
jgi:hypothetical protein